MTISDLHKNKLLLLNVISGSHAYGLQHAQSDMDKKGVFIAPKSIFYSLDNLDQINDAKNDEVYYEFRRFIDLLVKNNPNILELLMTPEDCILYKHPLMNLIQIEDFISKKAQHSFAGYAMAQIKKARGLNKKIVNPQTKERKSILDFCYVLKDHGSISLKTFLNEQQINSADCGLVKVAHFKGIFALFHDKNGMYKGIVKKENANELSLSSIPKGKQHLVYLYFNQDGYSAYCKEYKLYWEWVEKRNQSRYESTMNHGKNYDAKNMMHTFRLLHIAEEIAKTGRFQVRRTKDKAFLWEIRNGQFEYDDLVKMAETKILEINDLFQYSNLPESANQVKANEVLLEIRDSFYRKKLK